MRPRVPDEIWLAPLDAASRAAWRVDRRHAARHHHPDVGGDLQEYLRVTAEIDRTYGYGPKLATYRLGSATSGSASVRKDRRSRARRSLKAWRRKARAVSRNMRSRLPRWAPGARRYIQI